MRCPYCGFRESKVVDSRPADEGSSIRRRRECLSCEKRFTTYETVESLPMVVIKKDGSRQKLRPQQDPSGHPALLREAAGAGGGHGTHGQ